MLTDAAGVDEWPPEPTCRCWFTRTPRRSRRARGRRLWRSFRSGDAIGVTGTSGKTTTTYLVEAGLRAGGRMPGLIGTIGIRIDGADIPAR